MATDSITDDTITDDQIRELRANGARGLHPKYPTGQGLRDLCDLALGVAGVEVDAGGERLEDEDGELREADENEIEAARARCAEILRALGEESSTCFVSALPVLP